MECPRRAPIPSTFCNLVADTGPAEAAQEIEILDR